jgi:hypothetical protein
MKTYKDIHGWFNFSDFYDQIFDEFKDKKDIIFVEVGVWLGKSIIYMANKIKNHKSHIKLYGVDNFIGNENPNPRGNVAETKKISEDKFDGNFYSEYSQNLVDCGVRDFIFDISQPSSKAVETFDENSIDFIFIDGDHHYNSISNDLKIWYPKVKKGGVFSGHDRIHPGVSKALKEFSKKHKLEYKNVSKSSWMIRK